MRDGEQIVIDGKAKQVAELLKGKLADRHIGEILAKALNNIGPNKGTGSYHIEQIDKHNRVISFEKRIEYFAKLFNFLKENDHTSDNVNISEHDSAWFYETKLHSRGKLRKVIAISNMMGGASHIFIKEEYFIGEEDYSKYYIVRAYDNPDRFFKEDCKRKSIRTLMNSGKLRLFEDGYADGDRRISFDSYEASGYDPRRIEHDYEQCVLKYSCEDNTFITRSYFNLSRQCENALMQLESAYWMRTE
jgi:hypothetical protein